MWCETARYVEPCSPVHTVQLVVLCRLICWEHRSDTTLTMHNNAGLQWYTQYCKVDVILREPWCQRQQRNNACTASCFPLVPLPSAHICCSEAPHRIHWGNQTHRDTTTPITQLQPHAGSVARACHVLLISVKSFSEGSLGATGLALQL